MKCSKCGTYVPDGLNFKTCLSCGAELPAILVKIPAPISERTFSPEALQTGYSNEMSPAKKVMSQKRIAQVWGDRVIGWFVNMAGVLFWFEGSMVLGMAAVATGLLISGAAGTYTHLIRIGWFAMPGVHFAMVLAMLILLALGLGLFSAGIGLMRKAKQGAYGGLLWSGVHLWGSLQPGKSEGLWIFVFFSVVILSGLLRGIFSSKSGDVVASGKTGMARRPSKTHFLWWIMLTAFVLTAGGVTVAIKMGKFPFSELGRGENSADTFTEKFSELSGERLNKIGGFQLGIRESFSFKPFGMSVAQAVSGMNKTKKGGGVQPTRLLAGKRHSRIVMRQDMGKEVIHYILECKDQRCELLGGALFMKPTGEILPLPKENARIALDRILEDGTTNIDKA